MKPDLRDELIAMFEEDRRVRAELAAEGSLFQGYHPRMEEVHRRNGNRLAEIIKGRGWPGRSLVGEEAAGAAWVILQHAIGNPALQRRGLELLRQAVATGEAPWSQVAMLEDRIRCNEGRPQLYGTQFDWDQEGQMSPLPIEDRENVEERRRQMGLPPVAGVIRQMRQQFASEGRRPPKDWSTRQREIDAWARKVGWRS